jgi:hypothetical protein
MANVELIGTLKALKNERINVESELSKLNKAITALEELTGISTGTKNGHEQKRTLSAAARKKMAKAQKLRWAKVRKTQKANL